MLAPAGQGIRPLRQGGSADPLPRQEQRARFAVADQPNNRGARMGGQGSADLANPIAASLQHHHPRAGELLWRHVTRELGAEQHQIEGGARWRRRCSRSWLGGQGGERLDYRTASPGARPAAARACPVGGRGRGGTHRRKPEGPFALASGERGNGHRH